MKWDGSGSERKEQADGEKQRCMHGSQPYLVASQCDTIKLSEKKQLLNSKNYVHLVIIIPVHTRDTAGTGSGMPRYAKVDYRTRTHATCFGKTAGKPVPVPNPI